MLGYRKKEETKLLHMLSKYNNKARELSEYIFFNFITLASSFYQWTEN